MKVRGRRGAERALRAVRWAAALGLRKYVGYRGILGGISTCG